MPGPHAGTGRRPAEGEQDQAADTDDPDPAVLGQGSLAVATAVDLRNELAAGRGRAGKTVNVPVVADLVEARVPGNWQPSLGLDRPMATE